MGGVDPPGQQRARDAVRRKRGRLGGGAAGIEQLRARGVGRGPKQVGNFKGGAPRAGAPRAQHANAQEAGRAAWRASGRGPPPFTATAGAARAARQYARRAAWAAGAPHLLLQARLPGAALGVRERQPCAGVRSAERRTDRSSVALQTYTHCAHACTARRAWLTKLPHESVLSVSTIRSTIRSMAAVAATPSPRRRRPLPSQPAPPPTPRGRAPRPVRRRAARARARARAAHLWPTAARTRRPCRRCCRRGGPSHSPS